MREAFLALTDSGIAIYQEIVPMARAFSDSLCEGLSASELQQMNTLIDKLALRVASLGGN